MSPGKGMAVRPPARTVAGPRDDSASSAGEREAKSKLRDVLCGLLRGLRSLPQVEAAAVTQMLANIATARGGITWLHSAGITAPVALRLAHAMCRQQTPDVTQHACGHVSRSASTGSSGAPAAAEQVAHTHTQIGPHQEPLLLGQELGHAWQVVTPQPPGAGAPPSDAGRMQLQLKQVGPSGVAGGHDTLVCCVVHWQRRADSGTCCHRHAVNVNVVNVVVGLELSEQRGRDGHLALNMPLLGVTRACSDTDIPGGFSRECSEFAQTLLYGRAPQ